MNYDTNRPIFKAADVKSMPKAEQVLHGTTKRTPFFGALPFLIRIQA
ncbi:hypothetical protein B14911_08757 [Bacillus sp. NRRL B-14911]|nr:hypothetical protein B14911_08757 [Bacillus sp. NRRL B-14911]